MCGLFGAFNPFRPLTSKEHSIAVGAPVMQSHRGPDRLSLWRSARYIAAHNKLEIASRGSESNQPFFLGDLVLCFNGEVYNHRSLNVRDCNSFPPKSLEGESIICAFRDFGEKIFEKCDGEFAISVFDSATNTLTLARDRLGIKPLFYFRSIDGTYFYASEQRTLIETGLMDASINKDALRRLLLLQEWAPRVESYFNNIRVIPAGASVTISEKGCATNLYFQEKLQPTSVVGVSKRALEKHFYSAVYSRFGQTIWPPVISLSGGLDSSAISAVAGSIFGSPIKCCVADYLSGETKDEVGFVNLLSSKFNCLDIEFFSITPDLSEEKQSLLTKRLSEPICDTIPYILDSFYSEMSMKGIKVVISGEGSDDLWGGYLNECPEIGGQCPIEAYHRLIQRAQRQEFGFFRDGKVSTKSILSADCIKSTKKWLSDNLDIISHGIACTQITPIPSDIILSVTGPMRRNFHQLDAIASAFSMEVRFPFCAKSLVDLALHNRAEFNLGEDPKSWIREINTLARVPEICDRPKKSFASTKISLDHPTFDIGCAVDEILSCQVSRDCLDSNVSRHVLARLLDLSPKLFMHFRGVSAFCSAFEGG